MSYTIPISAYFPTRPGLSTAGFTPAGLPRVSSGVTEAAGLPGFYLATATLPDGWSGLVTWDTGEGPASLYAYEMISPPAAGVVPPAAAAAPAAGGAGDAGPLAFNYCTDEDIAARAQEDFPILVPSHQVKAQGTDGAFDAGYPWILRSTSVNFLAAGVHARHVVHLTKPASQYPAQGDLLAIDGVSTDGTSLSLRRIGQAPGQGQAPAPFAGLSGVTFAVRTFDPLIDVASDDANRIMGYDPMLSDRPPPYDPRSLQQYTVLSVLKRAYAIKVKGQESDLKQRYELIIEEWEEMKGHVVLKFGPRGQGAAAASALGGRVRR